MKGHIRQRGKRSFELKFDAGRDPSTGRRKIQYVAFRGSKREAQTKLAELIASVGKGGYVEPAKTTVADFVRGRLEHWQAAGEITPSTAQRYGQLIEHHIVPYIGSKSLQKLGTLDIEQWHRVLKASGRKGRHGRPDGGLHLRTVGHAHRLLRKALGEAQKHGLLLKNVCVLERAPRVSATEMTILTPEEVAALPAQLDGHELAAPALTALFTGMRQGEILALRWGNVDLVGKVIKVRESLEETKAGGLRPKSPKSKAGVRDITLPVIVVETLQAHRVRLLERRLQLGQGKLTSEDLVFPRWDGSAQSPKGFGATWGKLARAQGIPTTFHGLRHTHASQLIDAGVDVVTLARRFGHSSPTVTLTVYAHLFRKDDGKAAAAIDAAMGN
jgi:integrase